MKLKLPIKTDFSDVRLKKCFKLNFINKLEKLSHKRQEFSNSLSGILEDMEYNSFSKSEIKLTEKRFLEKLKFNQSVLLMDNSQKGKELFFQKYKIKKICLLCKEKRIQDCHILKRSFFKNQKRLRRPYKLFRNHFSNLVSLCPNHHDILDKTDKLCQGKINKIISFNKKIVSKMSRDIDRELKNLKKCESLFGELNFKISNSIQREIKNTIGKI